MHIHVTTTARTLTTHTRTHLSFPALSLAALAWFALLCGVGRVFLLQQDEGELLTLLLILSQQSEQLCVLLVELRAPLLQSLTRCLQLLACHLLLGRGALATGTRLAQLGASHLHAVLIAADDNTALMLEAADANVEVHALPAVLEDVASDPLEVAAVLVVIYRDELPDPATSEVLGIRESADADIAANPVTLDNVKACTLVQTSVGWKNVQLTESTDADAEVLASPAMLEDVASNSPEVAAVQQAWM